MKAVILFLSILIVISLFSCSDGGTGPKTNEPLRNFISNSNGFDVEETLDYHSRWSPDGSKIAFTLNDGHVTEVWIYDLLAQTISPLIQGKAGDLYLSWSPDGNSLVFDARDNNNINQLFVCNVETKSISQITLSSNHTWGADWCRATNKIVLEYEGYLSQMNSDGSNIEHIVSSPFECMMCSVSYDGSKIAYSSTRNGNSDIYIINRDGTNETRITNFSSTEMRPRFSPDGTKILYDSDRSGNMDIWVYNFNTNTHSQLTTSTDFDSMSDWSPDGNRIAYSAETDAVSQQSMISIISY